MTVLNFMTCGATKNIGPSQEQVDAAYVGTPLAEKVQVVEGVQTYVVKNTGVHRITIAGACGGPSKWRSLTSPGGKGAVIQTDLYLTRGDILYLWVGQQGWSDATITDIPVGGFGGGMGGGIGQNTASAAAGTGGGASAIALNNSNYADRILVAAGGGGSGCDAIGGHGGIERGADGAQAVDVSNYFKGGGGATQTSGGVLPSDASLTQTYKPTAGTLGDGGRSCGYNVGGGGGGGGYYGGGGCTLSAGGGGSSLLAGNVIYVEAGANDSDGYITIEEPNLLFLVQDGSDVKAWNESTQLYEKVGVAPVTMEMVKTYGTETYSYSRLGLIQPQPKLYTWSGDKLTIYPTSAIYEGIPTPQLVKMQEDLNYNEVYIKNITKITFTGNVVPPAELKFYVSGDSGVHWYSYNAGTWEAVDINNTIDVVAKGISYDVLSTITELEWAAILQNKKIRLSWYMNVPTLSSELVMQKVQIDYSQV